MSEEEQERFEDYLELERYIGELQAGHAAHLPTELTPAQARIYRMAALFRAASPEGAEPRPEFAQQLRARLEQEMVQAQQTQKIPILRKRGFGQIRKRLGQVSRRALLTGGAVAAASMVIGAGIEHAAEQMASSSIIPRRPVSLFPEDASVPTVWHFVTTVERLGKEAVQFSAGTVVGYVIHADDDADPQDRGKIIAMSAACTHMGCIVQWQSSDRSYHCPCHEGVFSEYGKVGTPQGTRYLYPLPRLETRVEDGKIYVKVPVFQGGGTLPWNTTASE